MTAKLNSYLHFNGNAKEAMQFYQSVFGGEVYSDTFGGFAKKAPDMPVAPEDKDKVMHAFLKGGNGIELMASDTPSHMEYQPGGQISLTVNGDDEVLLRSYWDKLSEGANVTVPLAESPWGDTFGMLTDKYGIGWMIDIGPVQAA